MHANKVLYKQTHEEMHLLLCRWQLLIQQLLLQLRTLCVWFIEIIKQWFNAGTKDVAFIQFYRELPLQ